MKPTSDVFVVDARVSVKIDVELAVLLGQLILGTDTTNTALLALGHQLRSINVKRKPDPDGLSPTVAGE